MTYGRSIRKAFDTFGIDREKWHELATNRAAWRRALHGELLGGGRPKRVKAAETVRRIDATLADERLGARKYELPRRAPPPPPPRPAAPRRAPPPPKRSREEAEAVKAAVHARFVSKYGAGFEYSDNIFNRYVAACREQGVTA